MKATSREGDALFEVVGLMFSTFPAPLAQCLKFRQGLLLPLYLEGRSNKKPDSDCLTADLTSAVYSCVTLG